MLTCIRKAFQMIDSYTYGKKTSLTLATVPKEDPVVYDMLCEADTIGVFQVESRAQMNMLPRLRPRDFYDLVVEVAIVRPGPIQGGMVQPYLQRREEQRDDPNQSFRIPQARPRNIRKMNWSRCSARPSASRLFQEQAMRLAIVAAEFTPDQANGLRRAMATFRHLGTIGTFQRSIYRRHDRARICETIRRSACFEQIKGFGSYGFPGKSRRQFRAIGLYFRLDQETPSCRFRRSSAQFPAHGLLRAC